MQAEAGTSGTSRHLFISIYHLQRAYLLTFHKNQLKISLHITLTTGILGDISQINTQRISIRSAQLRHRQENLHSLINRFHKSFHS